jgi:hypothetical protein
MDFQTSQSGAPLTNDLGVTWMRVEDTTLPRPLHIRVGQADGRLVCTGLLIESEPERELTARELREIKLPEILTALTRPRKSRWLNEHLAQQRVPQRARPGRRGYPDSFYRDVLKQYRRVRQTHPRAPIQALMLELHTTEPTLHRWLRKARELEKGQR